MFPTVEQQALAVGQPAEWQPARLVLTCRPGVETLFALLETQSANFLHPFSLQDAQTEHDAFTAALTARGITVLDLRAALAWDAEQDTQARARLEGWAAECVQLDLTGLPASEAPHVRANLARALAAMRPADLAEIILLRPTLQVHLNHDSLDPTTRFTTAFQVNPLTNAYYMRDPLFTTARGCVIGRASLPLRQPENDTAAWAMEQLGVQPLLRVQSPGTIEGGDFLPAGDFVLQGQGLLTNADGVAQCLEARVYGDVEVAVVIDPVEDMGEMHLDTYFTLLGPDLCALTEDRFSGPRAPRVDIYQPDETSGRYSLEQTGISFAAYLESKDLQILRISKADQADFAPNGLLINERDWLGVAQSSAAWQATLNGAGVQAGYLNFAALTGGYGGPHCSTQVLLRSHTPPPADFPLRRMN